jgi:hypothetical protein
VDLSVRGECDGALANDADFPVMGGKEVLLISAFTLKNKQEPVSNFKLQSANYCLPCFGRVSLGAGSDKDTGNQQQITTMRTELLSKHNVHDANDLSIAEVEELYDAIVNGKANEISGLDSVKFPILPSSAMDDSARRYIPLDFSDGAHFLRAEELSDTEVRDIVRILSQLITYSSATDKTVGLHQRALPDLLVSFAQGSRIDSGERLMTRASRHATDPRSPSILSATGEITFLNGETCILIDTKVQASMKTDQYRSRVCFSDKNLVSNSCECKSGSLGGEKVVCVHTPSVIARFAHLLLDGFIEHALCELSARWKAPGPQFDADIQCKIVLDLCRMMSIVKAEKWSGMIDQNLSIPAVLKDITVGTENAKAAPTPPPLNHLFVPLRDMVFQNPSQKVLTKVRKSLGVDVKPENPKKGNTSGSAAPEESINLHDYKKMKVVCDMVQAIVLKTLDNGEISHSAVDRSSDDAINACLGARLLEYRAAASGGTTLSTDDRQRLLAELTDALDEKKTGSRQKDSTKKSRVCDKDEEEKGDDESDECARPWLQSNEGGLACRKAICAAANVFAG